jgi:transcription elongation factor GreB
VVEAVHWAASNGDRSENGDYLYGKKRLREIDRRIRFLTKRLEIAEVADPSAHHGERPGVLRRHRDLRRRRRVPSAPSPSRASTRPTARGRGELDQRRSPACAAARAGGRRAARLVTPAGAQEIEVLKVRYYPAAASAG